MPEITSKVPQMPPASRSKMSNGSVILAGIDGRSREARRFRDVLGQIIADLGGADRLSESQRQLARRCAMLSIECEKIESKSVAGGQIDVAAYGQLTDRVGRAFSRLGLSWRRSNAR